MQRGGKMKGQLLIGLFKAGWQSYTDRNQKTGVVFDDKNFGDEEPGCGQYR